MSYDNWWKLKEKAEQNSNILFWKEVLSVMEEMDKEEKEQHIKLNSLSSFAKDCPLCGVKGALQKQYWRDAWAGEDFYYCLNCNNYVDSTATKRIVVRGD